jgi:hypothetical protein
VEWYMILDIGGNNSKKSWQDLLNTQVTIVFIKEGRMGYVVYLFSTLMMVV